LLHLSALSGMNFTAACPDGYQISSDVFNDALDLARLTGATLKQSEDPRKSVEDANVLYTDTWVSMGQEAEENGRLSIFPPYQLNEDLLSLADPSAIVMHCLPAHRGQEITDTVADGPNSVIFEQAENRMHAQKAILVHLLAE
jgi:ornithine carbamoyltransferase